MNTDKTYPVKYVITTIALSLIIILAFCTTIISAGRSARLKTSRMNDRLLDEINELRDSKGLDPLEMDNDLTVIADTRSIEASEKWSHDRPNGEPGTDMIPADRWRGENLSMVVYPDYTGSKNEQEKAADTMFDNLVASPAHYDNMVFDKYTKIGISTELINTPEGMKITTAYMFSS